MAENGAKKKAASSGRRARKASPRKASEPRVRLTPALEQELVAEGEAILANDAKIDKSVRAWLKGEDKRPAQTVEVEQEPPW